MRCDSPHPALRATLPAEGGGKEERERVVCLKRNSGLCCGVLRCIEEEQRLRRGQLTGLLEVAESGGVFAKRAAERLGDALAAVSDRPAPLHRRRFRRALALSLFALVQVLVLAGSSWVASDRPWRPTRTSWCCGFQGASMISVRIENGSAPRGSVYS